MLLLLAMLVTFASCKQVKTTTIHSYVTSDEVGTLYWYIYYGDNDSRVHYYNSRVPVEDFMSLAWDVADAIPSPVVGAKELPIQQVQMSPEENEEGEEAAESDNDSETDATAEGDSDGDSGSDSSSDSGGDSGGGDGGGGDGGGE